MKAFKWTIITLSGIAVLVVCFAITANIIAMQPVKAIDDSDILYRPRLINDDTNAFTVLLPVLKRMKDEKLSEQLKPFMEDSVIDFDKHPDVYNKVTPYLAVFDEAMTRDDFAFPAGYLSGITSEKPWDGQSVIILVKLKWSYVRKLLKDQKFPEACTEAEKLLKFSYLFQKAGGTLVDGAIAMVTKDMAISVAQEVGSQKNIDNKLRRKIIDSLQKYGDNSGLADAFRGDYTFLKIAMKLSTERDFKGRPELLTKYRQSGRIGLFYNENRTFNEFAIYTKQEVKNIKGRFAEVNHYRLQSAVEKKFPVVTSLILGNAVGRITIGAVLKGSDMVIKKFQKDAQVNLVITFLTIHSYHADHKVLPGNLADLVSAGYLDIVPEDPFDNKPLRYDAKNRAIYSVGADMKDDRGNAEKDIVLALGLM